MNVDQMAHSFALEILKTTHANHGHLSGSELENISETAWSLADLMKAEAEKREKEEAAKKRVEIQKLLSADNTFVEREGQHFDDVEWQPDWSLAPDWAKWWAIAKDGSAYWFNKSKPRMMSDYFETTYCGFGKMPFAEAPSFGYTGDWRDSLRMRPEGV